jgi:hypothetical protein
MAYSLSQYLIIIVFTLFSCLSCSESDGTEPQISIWETHEAFELEYSAPFGLAQSDKFQSTADHKGTSDLIEASGIVASISNPGYLWSHQDKNNTNEIFLIDASTGETVASYSLELIFNRDWEDIEIGPGPIEGINYLYVGEVGDNDRVYRDYKIYRFEEPKLQDIHLGNKNQIANELIETITFTYPDRLKHDVETLLLDPWTKDLFLVTKRDFFSIIYVLPYPQSTQENIRPIRVGEFPFTRAVGGNISRDGKEMLIKTYDFILHWERNTDETMVDMFKSIPQRAPYNPTEPQGEAICFDESKGYYTLSEFSNAIVPVLYHYPRLKP